MINFSIIIPHKNTPELLERCVKSIPERNDLEIIIVDDNSSPIIVNFEKFPCKERLNTRIIMNKDGKGAGYARNLALPLANGNWIIFADSDDFFNDCFNDLLNSYVNETADIIYFNANSLDSETLIPSNRVDHLKEFFNIYKENKNKGQLVFRFLFSEPWCKIIKRSIIDQNHIIFDNTKIDEDVLFSYTIGFVAKNIIIDERKAYCVTSREGSLCQTRSKESILDRFKVHAKWNKFLMDNNIDLEIPQYTYLIYQMSRHLHKDYKYFNSEYQYLIEIGYSRFYIWKQMLSNLRLTAELKIKKFKQSN